MLPSVSILSSAPSILHYPFALIESTTSQSHSVSRANTLNPDTLTYLYVTTCILINIHPFRRSIPPRTTLIPPCPEHSHSLCVDHHKIPLSAVRLRRYITVSSAVHLLTLLFLHPSRETVVILDHWKYTLHHLTVQHAEIVALI